ncbi:hypothetical protein J6590_016152 [Homalodisca vitripennis]|nr:hypothetical protein J6590_016152 [Homalodisca vitripennis]
MALLRTITQDGLYKAMIIQDTHVFTVQPPSSSIRITSLLITNGFYTEVSFYSYDYKRGKYECIRPTLVVVFTATIYHNKSTSLLVIHQMFQLTDKSSSSFSPVSLSDCGYSPEMSLITWYWEAYLMLSVWTR